MRLITKFSLSIAAVSVLFLGGCGQPNNSNEVKDVKSKKAIDDTQLSYRNHDLLENVAPPKVEYTKAQPGSSKKFKRAYQDAPPMIPHSVEGMLPITKDNNQCITCHVDSAPYDKTIPSVPPSHFTNYRPDTKLSKDGKIIKDGKEVVNATDLKVAKFKKLNTLYPGRFNCSQCHAPQANVKPLVANKFTPDYKKPDGAFKSSLNDDILEGL